MCTWFDRLTCIDFRREGSNSCFFIDCHITSSAVAVTFTFLSFTSDSTAYRKFQKNKIPLFLTGCTFIINPYGTVRFFNNSYTPWEVFPHLFLSFLHENKLWCYTSQVTEFTDNLPLKAALCELKTNWTMTLLEGGTKYFVASFVWGENSGTESITL